MKNYIKLFGAILVLSFASCGEPNRDPKTGNTSGKNNGDTSILMQVDQLNGDLNKVITGVSLVVSLDHHRMAEEEGVYTPPAIASIYSDKKINSDILAVTNPLVGLDLPLKFLCFSETDTSKAILAFTSSSFIAKRHGLNEEILDSLKAKLDVTIKNFDNVTISSTELTTVKKGFGIVKIKSDFGFDATVEKLKAIVNAQSDTRWFGEIDYKKEANEFKIELKPNILLLFGGPAPGAKAMITTPKIGLDAFCQKLLVYQDENEEIWIAFNDIVAFSDLYYGVSTKPQQVINQRLITTFSNAVKIKEKKQRS